MLKFERLEGHCGIPVFYQKLPDVLKCSAIALVVFTGSADDTSVGQPGIYHWFEHVPFRGTRKFPGGYAATKGTISRIGGSSGAWTNPFCTNYWATVPTRHLQTAIDVVVDLVAQPILSEEAIVAERTIIGQEIRDKLGSVGGYMIYTLPPILWQGHPLGAPTLGSIESLNSMTPNLMLKAREYGYDRSRMVFFVSTSLEENEILAMIACRFENLPSNGLAERRRGASFGPLSLKKGKRTVFETTFSASVVKIYFPSRPYANKDDIAKQVVLNNIFTHGGLGSPLYRAVREDRQLAYSASIDVFNSRDGGCWGFSVHTSKTNVDEVENVLRRILSDSQLRSKDWFDNFQKAIANAADMETIDPDANVDNAIRNVSIIGEAFDQQEIMDIILSFNHQQVLRWLDEISFEETHTIIAVGNG